MKHLLEDLFPAGIRASAATIADWVDELLPEERALIEQAIPSRQHEFSTGRRLARQLLAEFGHSEAPLLRDERVPRWPEGIVGSISHSSTRDASPPRTLCVAALAFGKAFRGIGVDCEPDEPVDQGVERVVLRGDEHAWVADAAGEERGRRCRIVFSVKEAVYKAFYPRTRVFWSFQDVIVSIDLERGRYVAALPISAGMPSVEGRVYRREGWILAATVVA